MRPDLLLATLLLAAGCAGVRHYPSLGTYHVDEPRLVVLALETSDTVAILTWADSLEVLDAPIEVRQSDDLFVVRTAAGVGRVGRDAIMTDLLFRSRYSRGRPIATDAAGGRYYLDEFGDTIAIRRRNPEIPRTPARELEPDVVIEEKELRRRRR